jgi:hypothetical protein
MLVTGSNEERTLVKSDSVRRYEEENCFLTSMPKKTTKKGIEQIT